MTRQKSEYLKSFGKAFEIFKALADEVLAQSGTDEDVSRILTDRKVRQEMVGLLLKQAKSAAGGVVRIMVRYFTDKGRRTLSEMISDCRLDYVNEDITEKHFPINKRQNGEVEMKIFHFNRAMESDEVIKEMEERGYRPAELPEGLAYAKVNPDEQRKYPIAILGSVWQGWDGDDPRVPCLLEWHGYRDLHLHWFGDDWDSDGRFLACRKS